MGLESRVPVAKSESRDMVVAKMREHASFHFFPAAAPLARYVDYFYYSHVSLSFASRVEAMRLPELEAQLVFVLEAGTAFPGGVPLGGGERACLFVQPAHLQMIPISSTIRGAVGAALRPAGLRLLLQRGAGNLTESPLIGLEDLLGAEGRLLLERMIEQPTADQRVGVLTQFLLARVSSVLPPNRAVARAIDLILRHHGEISTERLAEACGCTSRTLRSVTAAETGLPPKHLARVARIRRALELLNERRVPLSAAAVAAAFSDHAHMSREFRDLIGAPPSQLSQRLRSSAVPTFVTERKLTSTGLLVMPKDSAES